jgi:hypothetical protein
VYFHKFNVEIIGVFIFLAVPMELFCGEVPSLYHMDFKLSKQNFTAVQWIPMVGRKVSADLELKTVKAKLYGCAMDSNVQKRDACAS